MPPFDIATVGDNCIDRYLPPIGRSAVGGNAVNVAVHLAQMGHRVGYFGAVGEDAPGLRIVRCLQAKGIDVGHLRVVAGQETAYTDIGVDAAGDRIMLFEAFGACREYRPSPGECDLLRAMRHVHLGWLADGGALKRLLVAAGVGVSQDLSVNAHGHPVDFGAAELSLAFASAPSREAARAVIVRCLAEGAKAAVVTCGPLGSMASDGREIVEAEVRPVGVVDTLGAGDTFIAACLATRLLGGSLAACLEAGRAAAAATCTHLGGFPQTLEPL
jgi:fructoselysine 6-kinase